MDFQPRENSSFFLRLMKRFNVKETKRELGHLAV